jgi:pyruvate kinase
MEHPRPHLRKTKIIVTLGTSSSDIETLKALILGGMDMARLTDRFVSDKQAVLDNLKAAVKATGIEVGVMISLRGSEMRVACLNPEESMTLNEGQIVTITTDRAYPDFGRTLYCNNTEFPSLVVPGDKLLIDFGKIVFSVVSLEETRAEEGRSVGERAYDVQCVVGAEETKETVKDSYDIKQHNILYRLNSTEVAAKAVDRGSPDPTPDQHQEVIRDEAVQPTKRSLAVICRVEHSCTLVNSKPLHISTHDDRPTPVSSTNDPEDVSNLIWAAENDIDAVVFKQIKDSKPSAIEADYRCLVNIQSRYSTAAARELVDMTDGCLIGRGALALETSLSEVCRIQKSVTALCNELAKPMIISTQLLESMSTSSAPSRSEVTDITNAVLDGCDALLLSGETAYGHHPVLTLQACSKICLETERSQEYARVNGLATLRRPRRLSVAENICYCAVQSVARVQAVLLICITEKGCSAQLLSKYKPSCPILAITNSRRTFKFLRIVRGVIPALMQDLSGDFISHAIQIAKEMKLAQPDDKVVYICGNADHFISGDTSTLRVSKA